MELRITTDGRTGTLRTHEALGGALVAERFGKGPQAFLLLHGIGLGRSVYAELAALLAPHGEVIGVDLPGFGDAPEPDAVFTMPQHADLVASFLRAIGARRVTLIGHSMGSQVAVELAARYPELVSGLVLAGPTVDLDARTLIRQGTRLLLDLVGEKPRTMLKGAKEYLRAGPNLIAKARVTVKHEPERLYKDVTCPVLILRGARDLVVPERWCASMEERFLEAQVVEIDDRGHGTLITDPHDVAEAVISFASTLT